MKVRIKILSLIAAGSLLATAGCVEETPVAPDVAMSAAPSAAMVEGPCFAIVITEVEPHLTPDNVEQHDITFEVTNACPFAVSYIAIGTAGLPPVAPADRSTYNGELGQYRVVHTNLRGNPGFESIKFEASPKDALFKNGATEHFKITVQGYDGPDYLIHLQGHAGSVFETFTFPVGAAQEVDTQQAGSVFETFSGIQ